jgi:multidrug efflux system outer membrane protein
VRALKIAAAALVAGACAVGPDYQRPDLPIPERHRGAADAGDPAKTASFADADWRVVFEDAKLRALVEEALVSNFDVRIAAERVAEAAAQLREAGAGGLPFLDVAGSARAQDSDISRDGDVEAIGAALTWELDFWGKFHRANQAAQQRMLATDAGMRAVRQTLVSGVATGWYRLVELDQELEIATRTIESRRRSLELVTDRAKGGVNSRVEVLQAQVLVTTAQEQIPDIERRTALAEHFLCTLLGRNPGPISRNPGSLARAPRSNIPPGLPSELLGRRWDIVAVEHQLAAATADIGVAKALLYPSISLTGFGGVQSAELGNLDRESGGVWSVGANVLAPIFHWGELSAGVDFTEARQRELVLAYRSAIVGALAEVADALVSVKKTAEFRGHKDELVASLVEQADLSRIRFRGGVTTYLEVLDTERQLFEAELDRARAQLDERLSVVDLYRALGGGWNAGEVPPPGSPGQPPAPGLSPPPKSPAPAPKKASADAGAPESPDETASARDDAR